MDAVLLFSGQGAQKVGMGKDLYDQYPAARALIEQADKALGESLSSIMFEGPGEELTRTCNCQPALYVHGLACLAVLKELAPSLNPVAAAGLSLGEFTAHAAAGTYTFEEGLRLVQKRGAFMEEACNATKGTMAAMIGGTDENVIKLAQECDVDVANFNCPGQTVVSGTEEGVDKAIAGAKAAGCKIAKKLNVAGAYHSRLMHSAMVKLAEEPSARLPCPSTATMPPAWWKGRTTSAMCWSTRCAAPCAGRPPCRSWWTRATAFSLNWDRARRWPA